MLGLVELLRANGSCQHFLRLSQVRRHMASQHYPVVMFYPEAFSGLWFCAPFSQSQFLVNILKILHPLPQNQWNAMGLYHLFFLSQPALRLATVQGFVNAWVDCWLHARKLYKSLTKIVINSLLCLYITVLASRRRWRCGVRVEDNVARGARRENMYIYIYIYIYISTRFTSLLNPCLTWIRSWFSNCII